MDGLIIAAGKGKRLFSVLQKKNLHKALLPFLGLTLIERNILLLKKAGIKNIYIVIGFLKEKIRQYLGDGKKYGVKIIYIENNEYEKENGISVLKAKNYINDKFILLMADHVFDFGIINDLTKIDIKEGIILGIDKKFKYTNLDEATKVKEEKGKILDIGKNIYDFNAIDTGIFLCTKDIFKALEESIKNGDDTLSGGIKVLAKKEKAFALDIKDYYWFDIDTKEDYKKARKTLLKELKKKEDGFISKYLNRPVSTFISSYLVKLPITPNFISIMSFFLSIIAAILFMKNNYVYTIIAGLLVQFASIIDGCDGEIARLKIKFSEFGGWFDSVLDRYSDFFIITGITIGLFKATNNINVFLLGFISISGFFMISYTADKYEKYAKEKNINFYRFAGRDFRLFFIFLGSIFNKLFLTLIILSIITHLEVLYRIFFIKKVLK